MNIEDDGEHQSSDGEHQSSQGEDPDKPNLQKKPGERLRVGDGNREALATDRDARTSGMGNALLDLYIHPLDLVCHLFGKPKIIAIQQVAKDSYLLMLQHPHIIGTLELSTSYTWTSAEETLKVCTRSGVYTLSQMEDLAFSPTSPAVFGIPMEKLRPRHETKECHLHRNNRKPGKCYSRILIVFQINPFSP